MIADIESRTLRCIATPGIARTASTRGMPWLGSLPVDLLVLQASSKTMMSP
jgi:hypothetical protein